MTTEPLTPSQQQRLGELLMREFNMSEAGIRRPFGDAFPTSPLITPEKMLADMEKSQNRRIREFKAGHVEKFNAVLDDDEELFRFAYVPFVIAELVWDYADTVLSIARRCTATNKLRRAIIEARKEYDSLRKQFIDKNNRDREIENMYVFENGVKRIADQMLLNIHLDIDSEYPDLEPQERSMLVAVYQCHVFSKALIRYTQRQSARIEKKTGFPLGKILPDSYYIMDRLIPEYIGDKPASKRLKDLLKQYIVSLSTQMGLIVLDDTPQEDNFQKPPKQ